MEGVIKAKHRHLEGPKRQIRGEAKERMIPFLIGDLDLTEKEQGAHHDQRQTVMQ